MNFANFFLKSYLRGQFMKKLLLIICLVLALLITMAPQSQAYTITIDRINGYYSGNGGEFNVAPATLPGVSGYVASTLVNNRYGVLGFETFCLETTEYVTIPGTYDAEFNSKAILGQTVTGDPISVGTAWLYDQFARGVLSNYDYVAGAGRATSAGQLQATIWWLEQESGYNDPGNVFSNMVITYFGSSINAMVDATLGQYGVWVLNLKAIDTGARAQDQLVRVPEPGILILLGIAMSAVGLAARRFKI
jgi:hypothetical protein